MNTKTPDLGDYTGDPRIHVIDWRTIRAGRDTQLGLGLGGDRWYARTDDGENVVNGTLAECLVCVLGDPMQVGPVAGGCWLHTDGRIYKHDPATTGMIQQHMLRPGDVVDQPGLPAFEIVQPAAPMLDGLGRWTMAYPVRRLDTGTGATFSPRSGDMIPVRFAR